MELLRIEEASKKTVEFSLLAMVLMFFAPCNRILNQMKEVGKNYRAAAARLLQQILHSYFILVKEILCSNQKRPSSHPSTEKILHSVTT